MTRFPGPKMRLGQQSLATPDLSRVVAWGVVCGISLILIFGNNNTNLVIRTSGNNPKERPMAMKEAPEVPLR